MATPVPPAFSTILTDVTGYVSHLFAEFEAACQAASVEVAWLYTNTAERVYLRAGWKAAEVIQRPGRPPVTLMRRIIPSGPSISD